MTGEEEDYFTMTGEEDGSLNKWLVETAEAGNKADAGDVYDESKAKVEASKVEQEDKGSVSSAGPIDEPLLTPVR